MKHFAFAVALASAFPGIAAAEAAADPVDPALPVPPPAYRSVFRDLPKGLAGEPVDWTQANADVARFPRGHADYVKWEAQQAGAAKPATEAAPPPAPAPAATPTHRHRHH